MSFTHIQLIVEDHIAWIMFNRPEQLNAMNSVMMKEIIDALDQVNAMSTDTAKVCVISGHGKAFMAGADLKEYGHFSQAEFDAFQTKGRSLYAAIEGNSKPVIAAVNGYAFGGGFEIALACDMLIASAWAKFALPEILLELIPGGGGTQRLPMKLGINLANELLMTGKTVTAEWLMQRGLINQVIDKEQNFNEQAKAFAQQLTDKGSERLQAIKQLAQAATGGVNTAQLATENTYLGQFYRSDAGQNKIKAFMAKSKDSK